jgi:hypothetical protein
MALKKHEKSDRSLENEYIERWETHERERKDGTRKATILYTKNWMKMTEEIESETQFKAKRLRQMEPRNWNEKSDKNWETGD